MLVLLLSLLGMKNLLGFLKNYCIVLKLFVAVVAVAITAFVAAMSTVVAAAGGRLIVTWLFVLFHEPDILNKVFQ